MAATTSMPEHYVDYLDMKKSRTTLFIIDPQNDFHPGGSLAIPTANEDTSRIAKLIADHGKDIDDIIVSLDTHQKLHIAHGLFWVNDKGEHPAPFTPIPLSAVESGEWKTSLPQWQEWGLAYVKQLEANKRFTLLIWPEHCLVGTKGHAVVDELNTAMHGWCDERTRAINYVLKGHNMLTEHYSALRADVQREDDPRTQFNQVTFDRLRRADRVLVCGQALSHCVAFTTRDLLSEWPAEQASKVVLLTDCSSPVPSFEAAAEEFVSEVAAKGATVTTSDQLEW